MAKLMLKGILIVVLYLGGLLIVETVKLLTLQRALSKSDGLISPTKDNYMDYLMIPEIQKKNTFMQYLNHHKDTVLRSKGDDNSHLVSWSFSISLPSFLALIFASHIAYFYSLFLLGGFYGRFLDPDAEPARPVQQLLATVISYIYSVAVFMAIYLPLQLGSSSVKRARRSGLSLAMYLMLMLNLYFYLFPCRFSMAHVSRLFEGLPSSLNELLFFSSPLLPFLFLFPTKELEVVFEPLVATLYSLNLYKLSSRNMGELAKAMEGNFSHLTFPVYSTVCDDFGSYVVPSLAVWTSRVSDAFHFCLNNVVHVLFPSKIHPFKSLFLYLIAVIFLPKLATIFNLK